MDSWRERNHSHVRFAQVAAGPDRCRVRVVHATARQNIKGHAVRGPRLIRRGRFFGWIFASESQATCYQTIYLRGRKLLARVSERGGQSLFSRFPLYDLNSRLPFKWESGHRQVERRTVKPACRPTSLPPSKC